MDGSRLPAEAAARFGDDAVIRRVPASFRQNGSRMIVVRVADPDVAVLLDGAAAALWGMLNEPKAVKSLLQAVAAQTGEAAGEVRSLVTAALVELDDWKLLEFRR